MSSDHPAQVVSDEVRPHPAAREISTAADLDAVLAAGGPLRGVRIQDLDLAPHAPALLAREDLTGLVVLGGRLPAELDGHLRLHGALVFPTPPDAPVNPYRGRLYRPEELYQGLAQSGYRATPDARAYAWSRQAEHAHDAFVTVVQALHDDAISDALTELLEGRTVVGVMGGHAMLRGTREYAGAARLGQALAAAGRVVLTGGGPGAMEAANLGASCRDAGRLTAALDALAVVPSFRPSVDDWAAVALRVRAELADGGGSSDGGDLQVRSVGVPTWFYGHEPPNVFCDAIAKYFSNAVREDALLSRCTAGLVVLPGAAGTVQEIFQAVTPLYYAAETAPVPPLVLVDRTHWEQTIPVVPALRALGAQRGLGPSTHLVGTVEEAADLLTG